MRVPKSAPVILAGALFLFCVGVWSAVYAQAPFGEGSGVLTFAALDIGQGDALYIESPTGVQVLVDAGSGNGAVLRALPAVMPWGDRSIDAVIETHPDADHMGGMAGVLRRYSVGAFIEPGIIKHNATTDALAEEVAAQKLPDLIARRGMTLDLGGGARLDILYPDTDVTAFGNKTNDGSIVAHLVYGNTSVLLTADMPSNIEQYLMQVATSGELASTILKVGHHGSKYSTSAGFLAEVAPQEALISVGAHNTYGHPAPRVIDLLTQSHIKTLRTDEQGTIVCTSDSLRFTCTP